MIELIERLIERGHAYAAGGDVYFAVRSFPAYGALSRQKVDDVAQGEGERRRASATRWTSRCGRRAKPGEPSWPTPWGRGRPGLAPGVLGDGHHLPRPGVRHPRRRARPGVPAPRERAGPVARGRRRVRPVLAAQRLGHHGRREDVQVAGQHAVDRRRCCSGCAGWSCATTWSARTTGRPSSTPTPRCRSRWPRTGAIESFVHRVRERVGTPEPGDGVAGVHRGDGRRPGHAGRARRHPRRRPRGQHRARRAATAPRARAPRPVACGR